MASFSIEGYFACVAETITADAIQSYQGQGLLEDAPLIQGRDPLEDFRNFDNVDNDTIFQEYDPPLGDVSNMGWRRSRPPRWWMSLWKAVKCVFFIQIVGGLALGSLALLILVLDFNSVDLCYDRQLHGHWKSLPHKIQAIIVTAETVEAYIIQMWSFLLIITMFGWPLVKRLNLLVLNLLGAFFDTCYRLYLQVFEIYEKSWMSFPLNALFLAMVLMNSVLVGREIAERTARDRRIELRRILKVSSILAAQLVFVIPIDRKSTRLNSSHVSESRMPSSA